MSKQVEPRPLTLADIRRNMKAVSYVPNRPDQPVIRFRFDCTRPFLGSREEYLIAVIKDGDETVSYYDLVSLGLGPDYLGKLTDRICIPVDDE